MKFNNKTIIFILIVFIVISIIYYGRPRNSNEIAKEKFIKSLDLSFTLKIKEIIPTNNDRYSVLLGEVKSNKPDNYEAIFQNSYKYCLIKKSKGYIVFHCIESKTDPEVKQGDSLIFNSKVNKYWLYRHGQLVESYPITIGSEGNFTGPLSYDLSNSIYWKK